MTSAEQLENNQNPRSEQIASGAPHQLIHQDPATKSNAIGIPQISLPKGGGALKGIDEKFQVNPSNGTGTFSIPLPLSPNRNGFTPALVASYNSGAGNSILGIGWSLDFSSIQRKTDKRLPRYKDISDWTDFNPVAEEDTFMFSGDEDMVPFLKFEGENWKVDEKKAGEYVVRRYRPRIEGSFSKIERIIHPAHGMYWRVMSADNVTTLFGRSPDCRIADPDDPTRIFQWLPELSFDDKGSVTVFEYKKEDAEGFSGELPDRNRFAENGRLLFTNLYLKRVKYGNTAAFYPNENANPPFDPPLPPDSWHFELVLDYGDHQTDTPAPQPDRSWTLRPDPFSSYRGGFEIRTCRLLKRALMFHRFPELNNDKPTLVRSLDFQYVISDGSQETLETELEFLQSATQTGYSWTGAAYSRKSLPPMAFEYQPLVWNREIRQVSSADLLHAPTGLSGNYQFTDLYNEGISGILSEQGNGWFYKYNLGDTDDDGQAAFAPAELVMPKPSFSGLSSGVLQLQDLDADGGKQIVVNGGGLQGYFDLNPAEEGNWEPFHAFLKTANVNLNDPNVRMIDLNGDGKPEIVLSEENAFCWWAGLGRLGYEAPERIAKPFEEELGPAIVFSDAEQRIFLADMSGDGLTDIVRIRNGEVCYWPNLGYGRFGRKVSMSNAPLFDRPEQFNPGYVQLADISGTGASDLIYLGQNKFRAWLNLSGNRWGKTEEIEPFFPAEKPNRVVVTDLLGHGTGCLVWSSELPGYAGSPMRYIDLMGGKKPHIMTRYRNNMGKETTLYYRPSTWFYLKDKLAGKPWITRLPFPVQCVEKTVVEEKITGLRFASTYSYHHGHYDHAEREFRGFGRVEQLDTETFGTLQAAGAANAQNKELHQPPVLTKTWFHTGLYLDRKDKVLAQFEQEYWYHNAALASQGITPIEAPLPASQVMPDAAGVKESMDAQSWREALRACKGKMLRQEVFALDAPADNPDPDDLRRQATPYTVATHNCGVQVLQPRLNNPFAVFMVRENEAITYAYERRHEDPRVAHTLNIETDRYGNVLESASVVYGRFKTPQEIELDLDMATGPLLECIQKVRQAQAQVYITYSKNEFTADIHQSAVTHRLPVPWQTRMYELNGLETGRPLLSGGKINLYRLTDFKRILENPAITERPYANLAAPAGQMGKRLIEHTRTLYLNDDDLKTPLAAGVSGRLGLTYENYQLAWTPALRDAIFTANPATDNTASVQVNDADLTEGRFVLLEGNWWIRSGISHFLQPGSLETSADARVRFFAPRAYTDPFDSLTRVEYDPHHLFIRQVTDPVDNVSQVALFDYRTLSPLRMQDINDDLSAVLLDELGLVKAMAISGKGAEADDLNGLDAFATAADDALIDTFWAEIFAVETDSAILQQHGRGLLRHATARFVYDFDRFRLSGFDPQFPPAVTSIIREEHHAVLVQRGLDAGHRVQIACEYTDGLGKVVMKKAQAEPGEAKKLRANPDGSHGVEPINNGKMRWAGNGRTVFNNKGNPVLQYEPYFSVTAGYESAPALVETGVYTQVTYDPLGRVVRSDFPDDTNSRVEFDAWYQASFDRNDTAKETPWYAARKAAAGADKIAEGLRRSAQSVEIHANTPSRMFLDSLARPVLAVEHLKDQYGADEKHYTRLELDIEGNTRAIFDARFNRVMTYGYDMLGHRVFQDSPDAGKRWMFNNALGNPVKSWDQRRHLFTFKYDAAHRPTEKKVSGGDAAAPLDHIFEKTTYGEGQANDKALRLRGKIFQHWDTAGRSVSEAYDFKGNILRSSRRLTKDYQNTANWTAAAGETPLETESFTAHSLFDAMNRPTLQAAPRSDKPPARKYNLTQPQYGDGGILERVFVWLQHSALPADVLDTTTATLQPVRNVDYNEKGQRTRIQYGNGVTAVYEHDPLTFRLTRLRSTRNDNTLLQDLHYTYDPQGNITQIWDQAIPTTFFANHRVEPVGRYRYDSLYRLTEAIGREHIGQTGHGPADNWQDAWAKTSLNPNDAVALREYTQTYRYDVAGNLREMRHRANGAATANNWTRANDYETNSNRLKNTTTGDSAGLNTHNYPHHAQHGFITEMSHLQEMRWNFREELLKTVRRAGPNPEAAWYNYDAGGQRSRKINTSGAGTLLNERIYLGSLEIWRDNSGLERETLHLMDGEQRILMVDIRTQGADAFDAVTQRYQLGNHLGSTALELNETAAVISYEEYHPYGTTAYQATHAAIKCTAKRYRYTGMERDEETGLEYHSARYYVVWLGRWLSADPIGVGGGMNVFEYGQSNPVNSADRTGNWPKYLNNKLQEAKHSLQQFSQTTAGKVVMGVGEGQRELLKEAATMATTSPLTVGIQTAFAVRKESDVDKKKEIVKTAIAGMLPTSPVGAAVGAYVAAKTRKNPSSTDSALLDAADQGVKQLPFAKPAEDLNNAVQAYDRGDIQGMTKHAVVGGSHFAKEVLENTFALEGAVETKGVPIKEVSQNVEAAPIKSIPEGNLPFESIEANLDELIDNAQSSELKRYDAKKIKIKGSNYDRLEIELKTGKNALKKNAIDFWNEFLGPDQKSVPGEPNRIYSADGNKSIRYGKHEMTSSGGPHFHEETWNTFHVENLKRNISNWTK